MIEGTPARPYGMYTSDLLNVEVNMKNRRLYLKSKLPKDFDILSIVSFPLMGVPGFTYEPMKLNGPVALSQYIGDEAINEHPRFP